LCDRHGFDAEHIWHRRRGALLPGDDRLRHFECFNIVRVIEHESQSGKSEAEITTGLTNHCNHLEDHRRNICETIVPSQIPRVLELLKDKKRPDFVCEVLGFARGFGSGRLVSKANCITIVDSIRKEPGDEPVRPKVLDDEQMRERVWTERDGRPVRMRFDRPDDRFDRMLPMRLPRGPEICQAMDGDQKTVCMVLSRLVLRGMKEELRSGMSSEEICQKLEERHLIKLTDSEKSGQT